MHNFPRDGAMRFDGNFGSEQNDEAIGAAGPDRAKFGEPPLAIHGDAARYDARPQEDDFSQAGNLYRLMP